MLTIGILGLQGGIEEHENVVTRNGHKALFVRNKNDLENIDAIILPGGESTVMRGLLEQDVEFKKSLFNFLKTNPVYATCAGVILLSAEYFNILDIDVIRNGFGSQISSEVVNIKWNEITQKVAFIRAPIMKKKNKNIFKTEVYHRDELVGIETNNIIALAFHPELTDQDELFNYFVLTKLN